jgi:hypothetical protein
MFYLHLFDHLFQFQNTATRFDLEFGPIPDVRFSELDQELWCENYYLGNLCDEVRFPNWPIRDPIALLKGILDAWRHEEEKGLNTEGKEASMGETEAMAVLQIKEKPDDAQHWEDLVRTKYRKLARKYHPDRNPEGRDMFESIQKGMVVVVVVVVVVRKSVLTPILFFHVFCSCCSPIHQIHQTHQTLQCTQLHTNYTHQLHTNNTSITHQSHTPIIHTNHTHQSHTHTNTHQHTHNDTHTMTHTQ